MSLPSNPQPTSSSPSSHGHGGAPPLFSSPTSTSPGSSGIRIQQLPPRTTARSESMPSVPTGGHSTSAVGGQRQASQAATHPVVQLVQMTTQARRLQPALISVLEYVQRIEKDFDAQEEKLAQEVQQNKDYLQEKEQQLQAWQQEEQYKLDEQRHQLQIDTATFERRMEWEKERIQKEREEVNRMRTEGDAIVGRQEPVTVEVGGDKFRTELSTLTNDKCKDSIFPNLVRALERREEVRDQPNRPKRDPYIFIDRDGKHFKFILNYLRQGAQVMQGAALRKADEHDLRDILSEVRYYQLAELERLVIRKMASLQKPITFNILIMAAKLFLRIPAQPPPPQYKYVTGKDIKLTGKNLTEIEFNQVVFDHPTTFEGCLLVRAVFKQCRFNNLIKFVTTDLTGARFENCEGIQLSLRFCFENTINTDVKFNPPLDQSD